MSRVSTTFLFVGGLVVLFWSLATPNTMTLDNHTRFDYLADVAAKYGSDDLLILQRKQGVIDALSVSDLAMLAEAYEEIARRDDNKALSDHVKPPVADKKRRQLLMLVILFKDLADRGIEPFSSRKVQLVEDDAAFDWSKLPADLQYLAAPAERYGKYQFEGDIEAFLSSMTAADRAELRDINQKWAEDYEKIDKFRKAHRITEHRESKYVYFMLHMIAIANDCGELD